MFLALFSALVLAVGGALGVALRKSVRPILTVLLVWALLGGAFMVGGSYCVLYSFSSGAYHPEVDDGIEDGVRPMIDRCINSVLCWVLGVAVLFAIAADVGAVRFAPPEDTRPKDLAEGVRQAGGGQVSSAD